jgi:uncharacterized phage-associated protein
MLQNGEYVTAKRLGRWFVNHSDREAGESITQLKLQKLVYYADAWFLANFDRPLITEKFEAWAHGPAVRALYARYREHGWQSLPVESGPLPPKEIEGFLASVFKEYGQYSAKKLEDMTHTELPWMEARGNLAPEAASKVAISKLTMRNFYAGRIGKDPIIALQG